MDKKILKETGKTKKTNFKDNPMKDYKERSGCDICGRLCPTEWFRKKQVCDSCKADMKNRLTKEDIYKYGTKDEVEFLKEYINMAVKHPEIPDVGDVVLSGMKKWIIKKKQPMMDNPSEFTFIVAPFPVTMGPKAFKTISMKDITQVIQKGATRPID